MGEDDANGLEVVERCTIGYDKHDQRYHYGSETNKDITRLTGY